MSIAYFIKHNNEEEKNVFLFDFIVIFLILIENIETIADVLYAENHFIVMMRCDDTSQQLMKKN